MKERFTVREWKRYYEGRSMNSFMFCTENQGLAGLDDPMKIRMAFQTMLVGCSPNVICLRNGENSICFSGVKYVEVDAERTPIGTIIEIVCKNLTCGKGEVRYTLVAL